MKTTVMIQSNNPLPRTVKCNQTIGNFYKNRVYFVEYFTYNARENKHFVKIQGVPGLHSPNIFDEDKEARVNKLIKELKTSGCNRKIFVSVRMKEPRDVVISLSGTKQNTRNFKIPKEIFEKLSVGSMFVIGKDSNFCDFTIPQDSEYSRIQGFFIKFPDSSVAFFDTSANGTSIEI